MVAKITLVKTKAATGAYLAGMGTDTQGRYTVKGHEHITIKPLRGGTWIARNDRIGRVIAMDKTLRDLRLNLSSKLDQ